MGRKRKCDCGACKLCKKRLWVAARRARHTPEEKDSIRAAERVRMREYRKANYDTLLLKERAAGWRRLGIVFAPGETFESMFEAQGGVCLGCLKPLTIGKHCHVDHCHTTGRARGLLCRGCNVGIGSLGDDPATLDRLAAYLRSRQF